MINPTVALCDLMVTNPPSKGDVHLPICSPLVVWSTAHGSSRGEEYE